VPDGADGAVVRRAAGQLAEAGNDQMPAERALATLRAIADPIARARAAEGWADRARSLQSQIADIRRRAVYEATLRPGSTGESVAAELGVSPKSVSVSIATLRAEDRAMFGAALQVLMRPGVCAVSGDQLARGLRARDVLVQAQALLDAMGPGYDAAGLDSADMSLLAEAAARAGDVLRAGGALASRPGARIVEEQVPDPSAGSGGAPAQVAGAAGSADAGAQVAGGPAGVESAGAQLAGGPAGVGGVGAQLNRGPAGASGAGEVDALAPAVGGAVDTVGPARHAGAERSLLSRRRVPAPSIHDVAAAAGVSYQTVSRVLNDSPRVRPDTRRTVVEVIERLGYRPNRAARALGLGRAAAVTVVTSDTMLYGYASTLQGVEEAARAAGMAVGVRVVESASDADVQQAVDYVSDPSAGGVVVIAFDPAGGRVLDALSPDVPAIGAIEPAAAPDIDRPAICLDERVAAAEATQHLLNLGHRTVHHVTIPSETRTSVRQAGWRDALERAGASVPEVIPAGWDARGAYRAGLRLAKDPQVTAVLCGNDDLALGVRRALFEAGRDVPGDVSIVGFDDVPGAALWTPALTTVRMDFAALGRACFAGVAAQLLGSRPTETVLAPPRLIVRESTAPPRSTPAT